MAGELPTLRITVVDVTTQSNVDVDITPANTVDELIESVAAAWDKDVGAYTLMLNNQVLPAGAPLGTLPLQPGLVLHFLPDPQGG